MTAALPDPDIGNTGALPPRGNNIWRSFLRLWDRAAIYMPLLLMAALALGTYWLVRNTPIFSASQVVPAARHEVDYFMHKFTIKTFNEGGKLKTEIYGTEARHFADTEILEVDQAVIRSINVNGLVTTATANRAYANGDGSEVQLTGNAQVVREASRLAKGSETPRLEFRGEFLHVFLNEERVKSHKPVILTRGRDQFSGDALTYDNLDQVAVLTGRVRGILMPQSTSRSGQRIAPVGLPENKAASKL